MTPDLTASPVDLDAIRERCERVENATTATMARDEALELTLALAEDAPALLSLVDRLEAELDETDELLRRAVMLRIGEHAGNDCRAEWLNWNARVSAYLQRQPAKPDDLNRLRDLLSAPTDMEEER